MAKNAAWRRSVSDWKSELGRWFTKPTPEHVMYGSMFFDLRTLVSRRGILGIAGLGVGAVALAACTAVTDAAASTGADDDVIEAELLDD